MKTQKTIGWLLIAGAAGVFIPYSVLTIIFDYPNILRQDTAAILVKFQQGGGRLIAVWLLFALAGLPLWPAYKLIEQQLENKSAWIKTATSIGIAGLLVQMIGLLRWTFVVPVLAADFTQATDPAMKAAAIMSFKTIHQFAGVLMGEHLGQLFTITWTVMITTILANLKRMPKWITILGYTSAVIYFFAQAELLATVIPGFPVWGMAGFIGSTLWLVWLIVIGVKMLRSQQ